MAKKARAALTLGATERSPFWERSSGPRLLFAGCAILGCLSAFVFPWWFGVHEVGDVSRKYPSLAAYSGLAGAYVGFTVWTVLLGNWLWMDAWRALERKVDLRLLVLSLVAMALLFLMGNMSFSFGGGFSSGAIDAVDRALTRGSANQYDFDAVRLTAISMGGNVLAFLGIVSILVSAFMLARISGITDKPRVLADSIRRFSELLYVASALLVVGTSTIFSLFRVAAEVQNDSALKTAQSVGIAAGSFFTMLLVFIFLTVASIQEERINRLADDEAAAFKLKTQVEQEYFDRKKWLESNGFEEGGPRKLTIQVLALLGPLAAGLASKAFGG